MHLFKFTKLSFSKVSVILFLSIINLHLPLALKAQQNVEVSVSFPTGFIGTIGNNTQDATNIKTFTTLGITRASFVQSTSTGRFEIPSGYQGNDIPGIIRLQLSSGSTVDIQGSIVWRETANGNVRLFGAVPAQNITPVTINYGANSTYTINSTSNIGLNKIASTLTFSDGGSVSGNAASGVLDDLNAYLDAPKIQNYSSITFQENAVNTTAGLLYPTTSTSYTSGTPNFTGRTLRVDYVTQNGGSATGLLEDNLSVRNQGSNAGEVNVILGAPNTIRVGTTTVATFPSSLTGSGVSGEYLLITWSGSPTTAQVNAVLNNITYRTSSNNPTLVRYVKLSIADGSSTITNQMTVNVVPENDAPQAGASSTRSDITGVSDPISIWPITAGSGLTVGVNSNSPQSEQVPNAIDNDINTKYLNYYGANSGFVVTPATGATLVTKLTFTTANDSPERDPITYKLEGSKDGGSTYTTIVNSAATNLTTTRFAKAEGAEIANQEWYTTYRVTFPQLRSNTMMQIGEVELLGVPFQRVVYTLGSSAPVNVHPLVPVTDVDNNDQIQGATVKISTNFNTNDVLTWTSQNGITGSYASNTGILTFTGTATPATYQTLFRSIKFATQAPNSQGKERLVKFQVTDAGGLLSNEAEARIIVSNVPTLDSISNLGIASINSPKNITYAQLSAAAHNFADGDVEDSPLKLKVKSVSNNGTLTKSGVAVTAGTVIASGETLVWTPNTSGSNTVVMAVRAFDGDLESSTDVNVTLNVLNQTPPVITGPNGSGTTTSANSAKSFPENSTAVVYTFTADKSVTWSLDGGQDAAMFTINPNTGALTFLTPPDFENPTDGSTSGTNTYIVVIKATDSFSLSQTQTLTVTVTDVDDTAPIITGPNGNGTTTAATAAKSIPENTTALGSYTANETVTWSISGTDVSKFTISSSGVLIFTTAPNFENPTDSDANNTYIVIITATDASGNATTQTLTVTVTDVVENVAPTDIGLSASSIAENNAANATVGTLSSTDPDAGDTHTYTLVSGTGSTDNAAFNISGNSLRATAALDFETKSSYSIRIKTTDAGGLSFEKVFPISVTNANEAPTNIALSASSIAENNAANATVGALSSTDPDVGDTHTYTLVSGTGSTDNAAFNISGSNLRATNALDFETKSSYSIRIRTTDAGGLTYDKVFTVSVTNQNEAPTNIIPSQTSIYEGNTSGANVSNLSSTDPDAGDTHTYTLVSGAGSTDNASFSISGNQLKAAVVFDFKTKNSYSIRIRTTDAGGLSFEKTFTITVLESPFATGTGNMPGSQQITAASNNVTISKGYSSQLDVTGSGLVSYSWSPSTGLSATNIANPIASPSQTTVYAVTVTNNLGLSTVVYVTVNVIEDYNITPTNVITPNGDGVNDAWVIGNLNTYPDNEVQLFDKAGRMLYQVKGYQNNWDGTLNGNYLTEGTYFYMIKIGSKGFMKKGYINIIRE